MAGWLEADIGDAQFCAAVTPWLLQPVTLELLNRHEPGEVGRPEPTDALLTARSANERLVSGVLGMYMTPEHGDRLGRMMAQSVRNLVRDEGNEAWGGWAMLAAITSLMRHRDLPSKRTSPRPRAVRVGMAFHLGRVLTLAAALALIDS
jgi:hypothetical protein